MKLGLGFATLLGLAQLAAQERLPNQAAGEVALEYQSFGHEYRQDDLPALAEAPDGSVWGVWLSFDGRRDDIALRRWVDGGWSNLHWVPATSGDSWQPQVAVDAQNRVWAVWSQQVDGNWDIYARRFDPHKQTWSAVRRLSEAAQPDILPRVASDGQGRAVLVWQGFRNGHSNVFLRFLDGEGWGSSTRVTDRAANDWEPAVALASSGAAWVVYDSYKNGNYDVFLREIRDEGAGLEIAVSDTARFEARPTIAVDAQQRVWVAWEEGPANWGKDTGMILGDDAPGARLGGFREPRIRCWTNGRWLTPEAELAAVFPRSDAAYPHVMADRNGSVWVAALVYGQGPRREIFPFVHGYAEWRLTQLGADGWSTPLALPRSKGRFSSSVSGWVSRANELWLAWPTDNRNDALYHRPRRQQVFAGRFDPRRVDAPALSPARDEPIDPPAAHSDEPGDIEAIRGYRAEIGGKTLRILRGDLHRHTELSWDGGGKADGSLLDMYRYMIDAAGLDFGASTDHQGGAWPYWWWFTLKLSDMFHIPGAYAPIYGTERSASYPFGHRNVLFSERSRAIVTPQFLMEGAKKYQFPLEPEGDEPADETGDLVADDTRLLYEETRQAGGITIPHTSAMSNFGTDWADNDPELEPVVEIFQGARLSSEALGAPYAYDSQDHTRLRNRLAPDGMLSEAWGKGYKLGVIASSDHGSTHLSYAMVYADETSREGVLDAILRRRTYAATDNIILDVRMADAFMGGELNLDEPAPLEVAVYGTGPLALVEVIRDSKAVYAHKPESREAKFSFRDTGERADEHYYYVRVRQQDGMIAWSSPMFVNYR